MRPTKLIYFNWKPGIGDPTIGGWITVVLYLLAMISCWMTARSGIKEQRIWTAISILFLGLGINKQLDLQSALTVSRSRNRIRARMVWSTSNCAIGLHYLRDNGLRQRCYYVTDLDLPCAVIDMVCAARNDFSNWIRTNSCSLISPHRPIYRHHLSWLTLELDFRNGWDHHGAVSEPMAPDTTKTSRSGLNRCDCSDRAAQEAKAKR